ncbi:MAG TPA: DsbA family protein [Caulobacteraceae bacterium]|jgi:protein-disulfide isomerase|nr:DsbA family protein [Caulobacteraceae bacterium]
MRVFTGWIIAAAAVSLLSACGPKGGAASGGTEMELGNPNAKVTVTEWASVTCPHCAAFNEEVFPAFKAKYVDTGKVHYVFREFLTPPASVAAAGFLVARCAGKDKYFSVIDAIFHSQAELYNDPRGVLFRIGKGVGMTEDQVTKCIQDEAGLKALNERVDAAIKKDNITGTPSFTVNGKKLDGQTLAGSVYNGGEISMAQLDAALAPLLK